MENNEAKELVNDIFIRIENAKTINDLTITSDFLKIQIPKKYFINDSLYPPFDFEISKEEIETIALKDDFTFNDNITSQLETPLEKLFYAVAWKQGDLMKYKHIIKGIKEGQNDNALQNQALTFYQFGKYLNDRKTQPIIDQHVIRAFKFRNYDELDTNEISKIRKLYELTPKNKEDILNYKIWIRKLSVNFSEELREAYLFKVDRILMALGKAIKSK